jgi:hypothetical protein
VVQVLRTAGMTGGATASMTGGWIPGGGAGGVAAVALTDVSYGVVMSLAATGGAPAAVAEV